MARTLLSLNLDEFLVPSRSSESSGSSGGGKVFHRDVTKSYLVYYAHISDEDFNHHRNGYKLTVDLPADDSSD